MVISRHQGGLYLYGVALRAAGDAPLHSKGVRTEGRVRLLPKGPLAAVVSPVPLDDFACQRVEERLKTGEVRWVERKVLAHAEVLQELMQRGPVLPARFGIVFPDPDHLLSLLEARGGELIHLLHKVMGKAEWGLQICCAKEVVKDALRVEDPEIRGFQERLQRLSPGIAYLYRLHRQELERLLETRARERLGQWVQQIHRVLTTVSDAGKLLENGPIEGRDTSVLLAAYLVRTRGSERFRRELDRLTEKLGPQGLRFVFSGPWPPYHFAPVPLADEGSGQDKGADG